MEASALTHASQRGLLARRSPLLKLQGDERLIAMARSGNAGAFETIVDRYQGRLLGFCRQMLGSTEDAEDVLQEVFVNAYRAMLADEREINLRPWLYRIARNRCLNHLRKPTAAASESMDLVPGVEAASTAERVHNREEFRQLLADVGKLPETQRSALMLREMDAMSYEEIALAMDTSVPSVKSLLVRARISLAESSQARQLTCGEVRLELAEAAEGLRKVSGTVRRHVRDCKQCAAFRAEIRANDKVLAALSPVGPLLALKGFLASKLGFGGGASGGAGAAAGAGGTGAGAGTAGGVGAAIGGSGAASGLGAVGGALGTKAVAGVVTAAVITAGAAGAVEVKQQETAGPAAQPAAISRRVDGRVSAGIAPARPAPKPAPRHTPTQPALAPPPAEAAPPAAAPEAAATTTEAPAGQSSAGSGPPSGGEGTGKTSAPGVTGAEAQPGAEASGGTVVVAVGGPASPPPTPPAESAPPAESPPPPSEAPPAAEEPAPQAEAPEPSGE
ncbi:MAG TPA: RNA polymerase sigma factor [Solirubrobacterales bacterium]|nr:RNA polymerase sigma factor [Solirubrobacterales bacterium]